MRWMICVGLALGLSGCASLSALGGGQATNAEVLEAISRHMSGCDRHYQGGLGVGASFTFNIDCKAQPTPAS